ncbi:MAG TPA: helix-turn-helix transcriptional regulator [Polyangiaceae bacterium]|nr:helix-turn-helix transcriptional regulator [Polyangiaceae bacterium]
MAAVSRGDLVSVIEAAYRLDGDDGSWLARLVDRAARAGLDRGLGTCGMFYELDGERVHVSSPVGRGTPPGSIEALRALEVEAPSEITYRFIKEATAATGGRATCATMSSRLKVGNHIREIDVHQRFLAPLGIVDFMSVAATEPAGYGCLVGAPLGEVSSVRRGEAVAWSRVAAHMSAGMRLRRGRRTTSPDDADAVMTPGGRFEHVDESQNVGPDARASLDALQQAARAMTKARGNARRADPPGAVEAWKALVSGRWTLLDHFDHDGKRYVVAVRNEPQVPAAADLSPREAQVVAYAAQGHSNKLIAYELGIAPSTVAMHLSTAAAKLGARSRVELIRNWRARTGSS